MRRSNGGAATGRGVVVPIAFVSEHSETLVELDVEYRLFAEDSACPAYFRVPTQNADAAFIAARPHWCDMPGHPAPACAARRWRICPAENRCPCRLHTGRYRMTIGFADVVYPWTKAFHVISVIAWMAGMFYLPRLYVYHCDLSARLGRERALQGDGTPAASSRSSTRR